jgi:hypothetical protein
MREFVVQPNASKAIGGTLCIMAGAQIINPGAAPVILANETLTDDTGGTDSQTLAAVVAGSAYSQADMIAVKNSISSLAGTVNALITMLQSLGMGNQQVGSGVQPHPGPGGG